MKYNIYTSNIESPLGTLVAAATNVGICMLEFCDETNDQRQLKDLTKALNASFMNEENNHILLLKNELKQYFLGNLFSFKTPLHFVGTNFQKSVWTQLQSIPYGACITYKAQSIKLNNVLAIRAVAKANALNRIAIVVPCHRVIGSNGKLTGYSGGLWRKKWLLNFEKENTIMSQPINLFSQA